MAKASDDRRNRYGAIIEHLFRKHYRAGMSRVDFTREELVEVARELSIDVPKNLGDLIYSFRYRTPLPASVVKKTPAGKTWVIRPTGRSRYSFEAVTLASIVPNAAMVETRIPDATPGLIEMYALTDEQSLLAKLRYNRLIDIFTGITCYSLQSHLRTSVAGMGQVETDEIYVGLDRRGAQYVIPVQAKGGNDKLNIVQIEQDFKLCASKFPDLICKPVAAQFMSRDLIALFQFEEGAGGVGLVMEKHYRLVLPAEMTVEEIRMYQGRSGE